ncbi:MAG TPA: phage major capsid protein [Candidatus Acidoferrales bacterium]|nr:phage major capsid protein [Candidatus Acidoferrales bacterium]
MPKEMTREELKGYIEEVLKTALGSDFKERQQQMQQAQTEWMKQMMSGGHKQETIDKAAVVARIIKCLAANKGDAEKGAAWAKKAGWDMEDPINKEVFKALAAGNAEAGGFLIPPDYSSSIIDLLRAKAVVRASGAVQIPMPLGTLTVPKLTAGASASYVGENKNIAKTEQKFGQLKLTYRKLAALVPLSNDLLRFNAYGVDTIVRNDLVNAIRLREDLAFIRDDGSQDTPKGLRHWIPSANAIAANGTVNLANVTSDLGKLILALEEANVMFISPGWLMAPRSKAYLMTVRDANGNFAFREEMLGGQLWGFPFQVTTQIPKNLGGGGNESEVYFVDFADAVIGDALSIIIDASGEAAYFDGTEVVAAFSRDQTVVRAITQHDFGMRHDESAAVLTGVTWTP